MADWTEDLFSSLANTVSFFSRSGLKSLFSFLYFYVLLIIDHILSFFCGVFKWNNSSNRFTAIVLKMCSLDANLPYEIAVNISNNTH